MPCFVPFHSKNLDVSLSVLRPTGVFSDELIGALKCLSFHSEDLGCVHSCIFKSIHGNLVVWYGAWIKRSKENLEVLSKTLLSALAQVSHLAVLLQHDFYEAYAGESKDGGSAGKFSTGDTILLCGMVPSSGVDTSDLSYACLALHQSCFWKTEGISVAVCLRSHQHVDHHDQQQGRQGPMVASLQVWKSLGDCYSWLLTSDYRNTLKPYFTHLSHGAQFDVFKVIYVSTDDALFINNVVQFFPSILNQ